MTPISDIVPAGVRAILNALRFDSSTASMLDLSPDDLAFADRQHLTPLLSRFELSPATRTHVDGAVARNTLRMQRFAAAYDEMADKFDHVVLKGFTHAPDFIDDIRLRAQYDLDLYVPSAFNNETRDGARDALLALGYQPIGGMQGLAMDHLPTMIRKTGWQWRGDYFDPDLPAGVEVHFRFWDAPTECIRVEGLADFWTRRQGHRLDPIDMPRLRRSASHAPPAAWKCPRISRVGAGELPPCASRSGFLADLAQTAFALDAPDGSHRVSAGEIVVRMPRRGRGRI
jgi:hypothetical protein